MEPVIDFVDKTQPAKKEEKVEVQKKPVLIYKPMSTPSQEFKDPSVVNFKFKKKWLLYIIIILVILGIGAAGFLIGKYF